MNFNVLFLCCLTVNLLLLWNRESNTAFNENLMSSTLWGHKHAVHCLPLYYTAMGCMVFDAETVGKWAGDGTGREGAVTSLIILFGMM